MIIYYNFRTNQSLPSAIYYNFRTNQSLPSAIKGYAVSEC